MGVLGLAFIAFIGGLLMPHADNAIVKGALIGLFLAGIGIIYDRVKALLAG